MNKSMTKFEDYVINTLFDLIATANTKRNKTISNFNKLPFYSILLLY